MQRFAEAVSWVPVSPTFSGTLGRAHEYAVAQSHRTVTLEHLLLALAEDADASVVLQASNIDIGRVMHDVSAHLGHSDDRIPSGQHPDPGADEALIRILDYAAAAARQSKRRDINGAIVLAAIVGEGRSVAATLLQSQGLTFEGAIRALQRAPAAPRPPAAASVTVAPPPAAVDPAVTPVAPATPDQPPATINGSATQTNEQILANVRRRIDANRAAVKPAVPQPARSPYPLPPERAAAAEPRIEPPAPARPEPVVQEPVAPPRPAPTPAPVVSEAPPAPEVPTYGAAGYERPYAASAPSPRPDYLEDPHTGLLPDVAEPAQPAYPPAEVVAPAREPPRAGRRPPPLPAVPPLPAAAPRPAPILVEPPPSPLRPRQVGAPIAPPSSVAWPAPVQPQRQAYPAAPPMHEPEMVPESNPADGGIAGAPFPEPDSVPPRPIEQVPAPVRKRKGGREAAVQPGQLVENIPRAMRVGRMEVVEVRIARRTVEAVVEGMQGSGPSYLHDLVVTKAMSVRLRAMAHGFQIEPGSPETQWIDSDARTLGDDFASWRWNVTPLRRGQGRLQLIVSARTIASDGLSADTALPDQIIDVVVRADYGRLALRVAGWAGLMFLGGALSRFGQGSLDTALALWRGFQ